jgi:predicted RNA methylase
LRKAKEFGATATVVAELKYDIGKTYKCHKKDSMDVEVDFIRFQKNKK